MNTLAIEQCTNLDDNDYRNVLDEVHRSLERGDASVAMQVISRHLIQHPDCAEAHNDMAVLLHAAGEHASVLDHARRANELDPHNSQYTANYATVLVELGRWEEALSVLTKVVDAAPLDSTARALLKQVQVAACGRSEAATARRRPVSARSKAALPAPSGVAAGTGMSRARPEPMGIGRQLRLTANALRNRRVLVIASKAHASNPSDLDGGLEAGTPHLYWFDPNESRSPSSEPTGRRSPRSVPPPAAFPPNSLPFDSGSFDAVVSAGVFDARTDLRLLSEEIHRILVPNGLLRFQVTSSSASPSARPRRTRRSGRPGPSEAAAAAAGAVPVTADVAHEPAGSAVEQAAAANTREPSDGAVQAAFDWDPRLFPIHRERRQSQRSSVVSETVLWSNMESVADGVSVLMPVYNTPIAFCEQAVVSILSQTHATFEFVIVDDCSTDPAVREYLASLLGRDPRIRLVRTAESKGLAHALNVGLQACTGSVVVRMDSDDVARPRLLEKQVDFFGTHPDAIVCGVQIRLFGDVNGETRHPAIVDRWSALHRAGFWLTNHPGVGLRRDAILSLGGYGATLKGRAEDYELWCRVLADGWLIHNQPEVLLDYRSVTKPERSGDAWMAYLEGCRETLRW